MTDPVRISARPPRRVLPVAGVRAADAVPPVVLPLEHFAAALVWYVVASASLPIAAPYLAAGAYSAPPVIAVVHMLTIGFVLTIITGVLQQIAPVVMGVAARRAAIAHVAFALLVGGTSCVVIGAWRWSGALLGTGWTAVAAAVALTWFNLVSRLHLAPRGRDVALAVRTGFGMLMFALVIAAARLGVVFEWWTVSPRALLTAHVHLALAGFATVIAMGVGTQMVPAFLMVRSAHAWSGRVAWRATAAGALLVAAGSLTNVASLRAIGGAAMCGGVLAWFGFAISCFVRRGRRRLDTGVVMIAAAHMHLAGALSTGVALLFGSSPRLATAYVACALVGWLTLFMIGATTRIVPMLLRSRRGSTVARDTVVARTLAVISSSALIAAAFSLPVGVLQGSDAVVRAAASLQAGGVGVLLVHHALMAAARRRPVAAV